MEDVIEGNEEEVASDTTDVEETPISESEETSPQEEESSEPPPDGSESEDAAPEQYVPDLSYKVDREVRQMPEHVRALIRDKESEEYQRRLHEQGAGLPDIVNRRDRYRTERDDLRQKFDKLNFLAKNHPGELLDLVGFSNEQLFDIAKQRLDQRQSQDGGPSPVQNGPSGVEQYDARADRELLAQQNREVMRQLHEMKLQTALNQPEVSAFASEFDKRAGRTDAFREEVETYGDAEWAKSRGRNYVRPEDAVNHVYNKINGLLNPNGTTNNPAARQVQNGQSRPAIPGTIPNMGASKGVAPVRKQTESLDEMRKLAEAAMAAEQGR